MRSPSAARPSASRKKLPARGRKPEVPPPIPTVSGDGPSPRAPEAIEEQEDEAIRRMVEAAYT